MGPGYTSLPEGWVWDFIHWLVIIACFSPLILAICMIALNVLFSKPKKGLDRYD